MEPLPPGSSAASASALTAGIPSSPEIRIGARTGADIRTAAAIAASGLASSTRVTAAGRWASSVAGKTASAAPAALAAASPPPIRVVFLVAKAG